jgi:hypothetical protein
MVMLCDVGIFSEKFLGKIGDCLNRKGRLVVVDKFAPDSTSAPQSRLLSAFVASLEAPAQSASYITIEAVQARLLQAGFGNIATISVPHKDNLPWNVDWSMIIAQK